MPTGYYIRTKEHRELKRKIALEKGYGKWMKGRTGEKNPSWKGGVYIRNGYRYLYDVEVKIIAEHRLVMQNYLGRKLTSEEVVHHKNGNKLDNRIENLELTNKSNHFKMHVEKLTEACSKHRKNNPDKFLGNTKVPKTEHTKMYDMYMDGITVKEIAKKYNLNYMYVYRILNREKKI